MAPRSKKVRYNKANYPQMVVDGLEPVPTPNDGNCFFAAVSDQLYGNWDHAAEFRAAAVQYVRDHKADFIDFIEVKASGGTRTTAKRKNAGGYSISVDHGPATEEAKELQFKNRMDGMAKSGTYADSIEVRGLSCALGLTIQVYSPFLREPFGAGSPTAVAAVWYDPVANHYCSARKVDASREGPGLYQGCYQSPVKKLVEEAGSSSGVASPSPLAQLLDPGLSRSRSSTPGSVSIQRDNEDDDEVARSPKRAACERKIKTPASRKSPKLSKKSVPSSAPAAPKAAEKKVEEEILEPKLADKPSKVKIPATKSAAKPTGTSSSASTKGQSLPTPPMSRSGSSASQATPDEVLRLRAVNKSASRQTCSTARRGSSESETLATKVVKKIVKKAIGLNNTSESASPIVKTRRSSKAGQDPAAKTTESKPRRRLVRGIRPRSPEKDDV